MRLHARYATNIAAGNRLLILSSLVIDILGAYLLGSAIFGVSIRPYIGLVMVFALRQICQMLCPLPAPSGMVWRYPGVPAILVTYGRPDWLKRCIETLREDAARNPALALELKVAVNGSDPCGP